MRLYKRGDVWWCSFYVDGERQQKYTRCRDHKAAETAARQWERAGADPNHAAQDATSLSDALEMMIDDRTEKVAVGRGSAATVGFYQQKSGHLVRLLGQTLSLSRLAPLNGARLVDEYVSARRAEGASEATIAKELVTLRTSLKLARRRGLWRGEPAEVLPVGFAPDYKPRSRSLTPEELTKLMAQLLPDYAARVAFIVATSACWSESCRATREDVSASLRDVVVRGTKRASRFRTVPIVSDHQRSLLEYAMTHAQGVETLFLFWGNVNRDLKAACERAGTPRCSPNDLRRTCATWLRASGAPPELIAPVLGHVDSRMVERVYGRLPAEDLRVRLTATLGGFAHVEAAD